MSRIWALSAALPFVVMALSFALGTLVDAYFTPSAASDPAAIVMTAPAGTATAVVDIRLS